MGKIGVFLNKSGLGFFVGGGGLVFCQFYVGTLEAEMETRFQVRKRRLLLLTLLLFHPGGSNY